MAASISYQATDTDNSTIGSGASYTFTLTVAAASGQERLVAVGGIGDLTPNSTDFVSCTIDGQTATRVGSVSKGANDGGGVCALVTFYRAPGTSGTTINVVATNATAFGSFFSGYCSLWTLNDADTLLTSTNAAVNDPALNTNTVTNGVAAAAIMGYGGAGTISTVWTGLTEDVDSITVFGDDHWTAASAAISSGATPRSISANITPDKTSSVASICVSFNPDAAAGTTLSAAAGSYALTGTAVSDKFTLVAGQAGA